MSPYTPDEGTVVDTQTRVIDLALIIVQLERGAHANPHEADAMQYAEEELALAARDLARAIAELPDDQQPVGWWKP